MQTIAKASFALAFIGAAALGSAAPVDAQGFYLNAPGVHIGIGNPGYHDYYSGPRYYDYSPGYVGGGGWQTWNGCPPNYTIQGGVCKPYRGY
jgi:hypothetical protein